MPIKLRGDAIGKRFYKLKYYRYTNSHCTVNENSIVKKNTVPVIIGNYNWIGNRVVIVKGTETKDYTIVTTGNLLNKNYMKLDNNENYSMLTGTPAKIISHGMKRIYSVSVEKQIKKLFDSTNNLTYELDTAFQDDHDLHGMI